MLSFIRLWLLTAFRHSLGITDAVAFVVGLALHPIKRTYPEFAPMLGDDFIWNIIVGTLLTVFAARLLIAPYWLWKEQCERNEVLQNENNRLQQGGGDPNTITISASYMTPEALYGSGSLEILDDPESGGAYRFLAFDQSSEESAQWENWVPRLWVRTPVQFRFQWSFGDDVSGGVVFALSGKRVDDMSFPFSERVLAYGRNNTNNQLSWSSWSSTLDLSGVTEGDNYLFRITRIAADERDTLPADARIHAVQVRSVAGS